MDYFQQPRIIIFKLFENLPGYASNGTLLENAKDVSN